MELVEEVTSWQKVLGTCCIPSSPGSHQAVIPEGGYQHGAILVPHSSIALICRTGTVFRLGRHRSVFPSENSSCISCSSGMLNVADEASNTKGVSCSPFTPFPIKLRVLWCSCRTATPRSGSQERNQDMGDGCPSPAGVQACSQTFPTSTSPLHSTQSLLAARNYGGSSWSSLDCGLAVSRPGEHLRKWRGQQARDSETPWEGTACAAVQQRLERVQGMPVGIFAHSCSDPQHYTPQPGPPQHRPCSLLGCPFTHLQDTAQVPAPASSLLLLGHHPHLAQSRSEVVHRHPSPPAGQGTAEQAPAPHRSQSQQGVAVTSSSLSISLKSPH